MPDTLAPTAEALAADANLSGMTGFIAWLGIAISHYRFRKGYAWQGRDLAALHQSLFSAFSGLRWGAIGMSSKRGRAAWAHAHASERAQKSPDFAPTLWASGFAGGLRRCSACA